MAAVTVTTSATLITTGEGGASYPSECIITNDSGDSIYLGKDSTVTTSTGIHLATGSALGLQLVAGREVWGIGPGSSNIRVESWA